MSARDKIHQAVKNALIKDGWRITADPFSLRYKKVRLSVDLAAEKAFVAEKGTRKYWSKSKIFLMVQQSMT